MPTPVQIDAIVDGMEMQFDDTHSYLHRPTGRIVTVSDDAFRAAEDDNADLVTPEELAEAGRILSAENEYVALPDRFEIDEYRMMQRFAQGLSEAERDAALRALSGRGAFRYFKDTMQQLGLVKPWRDFRDTAYRNVARDWCEANGIAHDASHPDA